MAIYAKELSARLHYIRRIATGEITYASDFGRVCSIERISDLKRSLTRELREERARLLAKRKRT